MIDREKLLALREEYYTAILHYQGALAAINRLLEELDQSAAVPLRDLAQKINVTMDEPQPVKDGEK